MSTITHSIIGLPSSGKTTFLAALWHLIDAGEVSTAITLDKLVGDHQYLNEIVEAWRRCDLVPRTSIGTEVSIAIHIHLVLTGQRMVLNFSDLSGESFDSQFSNRRCTQSYKDVYDSEGGILLFVSADRVLDGLTILDIASTLQDEPPIAPAAPLREWVPEMVSAQVKLVDLLQFLQRNPFPRRKRRLAIVVSAWDVVTSPKPEPKDWLSRELPLLGQFLLGNQDSFEYRVYGVSAQGGDVTGSSKSELLKVSPSKRIICAGPETSPHDLTQPLVWLAKEF